MTCTGGAHCIILELITPLHTHHDTDDLREGKNPFLNDLREGKNPFLKSGPLHNPSNYRSKAFAAAPENDFQGVNRP